MGERCICHDYTMTFRGNSGESYELEFEVWADGAGNWWLNFGGVQQELDQFSPPQIQAVADYVHDWRAR